MLNSRMLHTLHSGPLVDREVALERKCDTFVEAFVVHLLFVGQVGPSYEGKHPLLMSFPSNVPN